MELKVNTDMSTIDMPIFGNTLQLMKFWSYLFVHNWKRYVALVPYMLINLTQYVDIYLSTEPLNFILRNVYLAVLFTNTVVRGVLLCVQRKRYESFLELLKNYYIQLLKSSDPHIAQLVFETTRLSNTIGRVNLLMGGCTCIGFVTSPLFGSERVLPFGMTLPGVDKYASPYYEIFFCIQFVMSPIGCCMYIPYSNLVITFTLFAILMCRVLQHKLHSLKDLDSSHIALRRDRFVEAMNKLTTYLYLMEFLCFGSMLCVLLFSFIIAPNIYERIIVIAYIVMIFSNSVVLYYVSNELYFQSFNVSIAAYETNWMDFDIETQKTLKLLILRSQKPMAILVGDAYPMNLQLLKSLVNSMYSVFTLLRRMYG